MEELQKGLKSLKFMQKIIQLTDQSEFSRDAIEEYEMDELAGMMTSSSTWKAEKAVEQKVIKYKNGTALRQGKRMESQG